MGCFVSVNPTGISTLKEASLINSALQVVRGDSYHHLWRIQMKVLTVALIAAGVAFAGQVAADEALAKAKNCLTCHAADKKVVGPSYKDVAAKYKGQGDAVAKLAAKIKTGGKGVWGEVPMPPNNVTDDEAKKLAAWVLAAK
jgi:cytochrome c